MGSPLRASPLPTDEEFNMFHSIDRNLYKKLILSLGRDMEESMRVMAFWLWLERQRDIGARNLVNRILSFSSNKLLNDIADESMACLKCMEKDQISSSESAYKLTSIPLNRDIDLKFFFENRTVILLGVKNVLNEVCERAFKDINQAAIGSHTVSNASGGRASSSSGVLQADQSAGSSMVGRTILPEFHTSEGLRFTEELQKQKMQHTRGDDPNDRTIVLTFWDRNPISEQEIRDFFTRKFGDHFIEEIQMDVEQFSGGLLNARVVARMNSNVNAVVKAGIAEYYINGKPLYAQKYVTNS